jgi:archaellum component FlaC
MQIESEKDFPELRDQFNKWRKSFPMFKHDVKKIEDTVERLIKEYSVSLMHYRQSKKRYYLEQAQTHIDEINRVVATIEKIELMALLSRR